MADNKIPNAEAKRLGFNLNPTQLTQEEYDAIKAEHQEFLRKQEQASCEFMWQHYKRILRDLDKSIARGSQAVIVAQRQNRQSTNTNRKQAIQQREHNKQQR